MYCPECRSEYREGFAECSDCRVPLVVERPPEPKGPGDPELAWVMVLEGCDRLVLASAKGLLQDAGIPFYVAGDEIGPRAALVDDFIYPWWRIHVGLDREKEAQSLLQTIAEADPGSDYGEEEKAEDPA